MEHFQLYKTVLMISLIVNITTSEVVNKEHYYRKPTKKEIITAVFSLNMEKLRNCQSCNNVGTDSNDSTIGQYLAGFLSYFADSSGVNYLDIECTALKFNKSRCTSINDIPVWQVDFNICRKKISENEVWCWGLRFQMNRSLQVIKSSLICIGSG